MSNAIPHVLVVDDSATSRAMLYKQVGQCGCRVDCVENGSAALAAMAAHSYDLVLLDCYMPDMNGYEVAREVRASEDGGERYTPLIGISAEADAAHVQLCLDSGMDGILGKPLPLAEFRKILALWCDYEQSSASGEGSAPLALPEAPPSGTVDLQALFFTTTLHDLGQMRQAYARGDIEGGKRMAHRMKGAALTMRRERIVELLERIEQASSRLDSMGLATIVAAMDELQAGLGA